jgi:hypothetical protein
MMQKGAFERLFFAWLRYMLLGPCYWDRAIGAIGAGTLSMCAINQLIKN